MHSYEENEVSHHINMLKNIKVNTKVKKKKLFKEN